MATPSTPSLTLAIDGMTCASCVRRVERALAAIPGVTSASVNLATGQAIVQHEAALNGSVLADAAARAATRAGYASHVVDDQPPAAPPSDRRDGWIAVTALAISMPLVLPMLLAPLGVHWMPPAWIQFALATFVVFGLGARFFVGAYKALRSGSANMDVLVALGTGAAWGLSVWLWQRDPNGAAHNLYFESAAMVVALVLLGKWLETRARRRTLVALSSLRSLRPDIVTISIDGHERDIPLAQAQVGQMVVVRAGGRVPVDGRIVQGRTHIDESMLTGEGQPVSKAEGDAVAAGTLNVDGVILLRTTAVGAQTSLARIVKLVESAQAQKAPVQQLVDRVAEVFVPAVVVIATLTLIGWKLAGADHASAIIHAVSVLVIACPCALGLATPAALMVGTGLAAQRGLLVREARALEVMRDVSLVAFDKTGTLTRGEPALLEVVPAATGIDHDGVLRSAASLQRHSSHPLARAVMRAAEGRVEAVDVVDHRVMAGRGVEGTVQGMSMLLGSDAWMDELGVQRGPLAARAKALQDEGRSVAWLAMRLGSDASKVFALGLLAFGDEPKAEAAGVIEGLRQRGVRSVLVSGDNLGAATALARKLGIDEVRAPVLPHDKARIVGELKKSLPEGRRVAMVGDGINDAPALAAADVGLAMGTGTDVAMETAGLTLLRGDLNLVLEAFDLSKAVTAKVRQNLFWAFAYNVVGIPLAAFGFLSPMVAGAAMALSSVSVVANALTLRNWRPGA